MGKGGCGLGNAMEMTCDILTFQLIMLRMILQLVHKRYSYAFYVGIQKHEYAGWRKQPLIFNVAIFL